MSNEGTTVITLANGEQVAIADWVDDILTGSVQLFNGQTGTVEAFSAGRSMPIPGGTRQQLSADTNVPRNGDSGLPNGHEMLVYGISIHFVRACRPPTGATQPVQADGNGALSAPVSFETMFNISRVTSFEFYRAGKVYASGTPLDFPAGLGMSGVSTRSDVEIANNGSSLRRERQTLVLPIHLKSNEAFKGVFTPGSPLTINQPASSGANLTFADVRTVLSGLIKRPVQ